MKTKLIVVFVLILILQSCSHELKVMQPKELSEVKIESKTMIEYLSNQGSLSRLNRKENDGIVYINGEWSDQGTYIKAVESSSNNELWKFPIQSDSITTPVFDETRIFFGSSIGIYYALDKKTGSELWSYKAPKDISGFNVMHKKSILFRDFDSKIYSLDTETGSLNWIFDLKTIFSTDYSIYRGPIYHAGVMFFALNRNMLLGVSADTGSETWRVDYNFSDGDEFYLQNGQIFTIQNTKFKTIGQDTPKEDAYNFNDVVTDENLFVNLLSFDINTGRKLWENKVEEINEQKITEQLITKKPPLWSKATNLRYELPPIFTKKHVFFNDRFCVLHGFNPKTGKKDITINLLPYYVYRKFYAPTLLVSDKTVYFIGADNTLEQTFLYALNLDNGKLMWQKNLGKEPDAEIKLQGTAIFLILSGRLIVINQKNGDETIHLRIPFAYNLVEIQKDALVINRSDPTDADKEYSISLRWKNK